MVEFFFRQLKKQWHFNDCFVIKIISVIPHEFMMEIIDSKYCVTVPLASDIMFCLFARRRRNNSAKIFFSIAAS